MASPISPTALLGCSLLSSHRVLACLQANPYHTPIKDVLLREALYLTHQPWAAREPDHVFGRAWEAWEAYRQQPNDSLLMVALQLLSEDFLTARHGELRVKLNRFGAWQQSVLSRVSGQAIQAAAYVWPPRDCFLQALAVPTAGASEQGVWQQHALLLPYDPLVEEYFRREGLHETHLHLNGSTHAELCWLRALHAPEEETKDFCDRFQSQTREARYLRELACAIQPDFSAALLRRQLFVARQLRNYLLAASLGCLADDTPLPQDEEALFREATVYFPPRGLQSSVEYARMSRLDEASVATERYWLYRLLKRLRVTGSVTLTNMLHNYLLLQNLYYRLLVQSEEQYGFDQFQKVTWTDLREPAEKDYLARFCSMHGPLHGQSRIVYLEGRFAPKDTEEKNLALLELILRGYWMYLQDSTPPEPLTELLAAFEKKIKEATLGKGRYMRLGLVAHFVKMPESADDTPYRFYRLRGRLMEQAHTLRTSLEHYPSLRRWVRGVDAAANELDAPPEVFASAFRICRATGLTHRSFHAGEDFHHLLSGIRAMLDALELLDLREGDRIGHGTAMGISPDLWLSRMPGQVRVRKDDWLLDLLATWRLLKKAGETSLAYRIECDLTDLGCELLRQEVSGVALERAMRLRGLNVRYLHAVFSGQTPGAPLPSAVDIVSPLQDAERAEAEQVDDATRTHRAECELLWRWLSDADVRARGRKLIPVECGYFSAREYVKVQQALMTEFKERSVLIETLPSSNVRISQYEQFEEHHAFRWMRLPGFLQDGDPEIMVTLGSDDPGIFAGELAGEFYQLYAVLRGLGLHDKDALRKVAELNERGREYRFHDFEIG
jgi:adenosine deaminase